MHKKEFCFTLAIIFVGLLFSGCGPSTFLRTRTEFCPYSQNENTQTQEGITIERHDLKKLPPEFTVNVQKCDPSDGMMLVDSNRKPIMEKVIALPKGSMLEKISITNNTGHIVRLNTTVITAFDPADNQYDTLSKGELKSYLLQERPCTSTNQMINQLNIVKLIDRNTELLPNRTTNGYLVYKPRDTSIPGIWKLSIYELPVATNAAGIVMQTVNFNFRSVCKKFQDTYRQDNLLADPVKISSEEIK